MTLTFRLALIAIAVTAAFVPLPPGAIERWYSSSLYLLMQRGLTAFSNLATFALFDVVIIAIAAAWIIAAAIDVARRRRLGWFRVLLRAVARTAVWGAAVYLLFLIAWGFNYRRLPLPDKLAFDAAQISPEGARRLAIAAVERVNALHAEAHATGWAGPHVIDPPLASAFDRVQREIGSSRTARPARPKWSLLDPYFRMAAVDGMTDPFLLETLVASSLLPFERPFVVAHEWSHLAGFADEGEANFVGWLTCLRSAPRDQYSGWLFLYSEVARTLDRGERDDVIKRLDAGPREDLRAVAERLRRQVNPRLQAVGWTVYDSYLKANRIEAGARSYAEVVRLVLGARFTPEWGPVLMK